MFIKMSKKTLKVYNEALEAGDYTRAKDIREAEFEGWKQGFKSSLSSVGCGLVIGSIAVVVYAKVVKN